MTSATVLISALETPMLLEQGAHTLTVLASVGAEAGAIVSVRRAATVLEQGGGSVSLLTSVADVTLSAPSDRSTDITVTAAMPLGGHRVVRLTPQGVEYASASDVGVDAVLGVTVGAASTGDQVTIRTSGPLAESSWSWSPGPVYLAGNGLLSQTPPVSGALREIGVSLDATTLLIRIQSEIYLG